MPDGGAIYNYGTMTIVNSTFANNRAKGNGTTFYNNGGTIELKNTILSTDNKFEIKCAGSQITDGGGNLQWPNSDNSCVGVFGDPKLAKLAIDGGSTPTLGLLPGSAAIDAGINSVCASDPINHNSQNGVTRPHGQQCDIGAYEYDYLVVVSAITRLDADPTNKEHVRFLVTFSKPVTGVSLQDFSLTTTGISTASITSVMGTGSTYTVIVDTGLNSGTLKLNVIDDDTILDSDGFPLGGAGKGNGDFTTGEVYTIDRHPPYVVSITRINPNPSSAKTVDFLVTFSEPVSGVDMSDFRLVGEGLSGAEVINIHGLDQSFTITATSGTGDGTLRLNLIDNDSIIDAAKNPLGGFGMNNGNFLIGEIYTIKDPPIFNDVPVDHFAFEAIELLYNTGITSGCTLYPLNFCPNLIVTRAEMAAFLLRTNHGTQFNPPNLSNIFMDVPSTYWAAMYIEQLFAEGITKGCSTDPHKFCPEDPVTRAEMAAFILRTTHGGDYEPLTTIGIFNDVPPTHWAAGYIEQLLTEEITKGCSEEPLNYCPESYVTRAEMALFLVRAFSLSDQ